MLISELIQELERKKAWYGDVRLHDYNGKEFNAEIYMDSPRGKLTIETKSENKFVVPSEGWVD